MTAIPVPYYPKRQIDLRPWFVVAGILVVLIMSAHAYYSHRDDAITIHNWCSQPGGALKTLWNPFTGRYAKVCDISGRFGVDICVATSSGEEMCVTAFFKEKMGRLDQVLKYLSNRGYIILK